MNVKSLAVRYGTYSFLCIALFFLLMKLFSLENVASLRFVNILFVLYFTNRMAKMNYSIEKDDYLQQWSQLIVMNVITVALSFFSFTFYAKYLDPDFMKHFQGGILWNNNISYGQAAMSLFAEGIGVAVTISFIVMQYWNQSPSKSKSKKIVE